jgi:rhamnopyranosyl-N-acetylglucosaminyl-diphospho-decaprenol beta-1,3/1,4-galactofuranosyltransferase
MLSETHIAAVVVTHNRRDLIEEALTAVGVQTRRPDVVIVVDNASDDGTAEFLRAQPVQLVTLDRNTGGAGGFTVGIDRALAAGADLIWLMDDDTVPAPGALAALLDAFERFSGRPGLVASRVVWTDGRDHPMNTPRVRPGATAGALAAASEVGCLPIRSASFVSILVDASAVRECGLPIADYFLWNDDFEFTMRLLRDRVGLLCPDSAVVHKTRVFDGDPGPRFFYEVRNKVWLFTRSSGLGPAERLLYLGSTLRRWAVTIARSADRLVLLRCLVRGLSAGVSGGPRRSETLLAELDLPR